MNQAPDWFRNAAGGPEWTGRVVHITPEAATRLLEQNRGNRPIRKSYVADLARDMRAGQFKVTHQGIAISKAGDLLDGQHRLSAIVAAGIAVPMLVFVDADPQTFAYLDLGQKRTVRDVLRVDQRIIDPCNYVARLHDLGSVKPYQAAAVMDVLGEPLLDMLVAAGSIARGRTAAPVRAAAALRMVQGHREYVLKQWVALCNMQFDDMTPAIKSLFRQLTDGSSAVGGNSIQNDRACRAWIAFDPARASITRVQLSNPGVHLAEMRAVFTPAWGDPSRELKVA